jgi:hypothetical protein
VPHDPLLPLQRGAAPNVAGDAQSWPVRNFDMKSFGVLLFFLRQETLDHEQKMGKPYAKDNFISSAKR